MQDSSKYNHTVIEKKWQAKWRETKLYNPDILHTQRKSKFYNLWMFPYPSAEGLHAGHAFASTGSDIAGRFQRMHAKTVFQPIGYDSFGIHTENFAIKIGETPQKLLARATIHYEQQFRSMGHGYDWTRTVATHEKDYYKWTQWLFVKLFKAGLAYKKKAFVNWCPSCKTVLSDEQVVTPAQAGKFPLGYSSTEEVPEGIRVCERCGSIPERKELSQWFFRITKYADRLLDNLPKIDWTEKVKVAQKEWIGRSEGANVKFDLKGKNLNLEVFTTRLDTIDGVTFLVLAPEKVDSLLEIIPASNLKNVSKYIKDSLNKSEQQRKRGEKEKTGVNTGLLAINPSNLQEIPVWIADYVLMDYGTGVVMGVPYFDDRDKAFAEKFSLPIQKIKLNKEIINAKKIWFKKKVHYHLRDWLISRQRYWGPPIPMIHCKKCASAGKSFFDLQSVTLKVEQTDWKHAGWYPEENLPVVLPEISDYQPEGNGKGPLANHPDFYKVNCPNCGGEAERETDVSDTFVDSSWYFLRYPSVDAESSSKMSFDNKITKSWLPVDLYFGGAEHSVLHLMYARFVTMVLSDLKLIDFEEPFPRFYAHGLMIKDGAKMSKSRGNVVNPDEYIEKFGADTLRLYLMFMGPMDGFPDFRDTGMEGMQRFVNKLANIFSQTHVDKEDGELTAKLHQTIKKVTKDVASFNYNTAISSLMEYVNHLNTKKNYSKMYLLPLAQMIAPFAPHLAEEAWEQLGQNYSIHTSAWPDYQEELTKPAELTVIVQVDGKVRSQLQVASGQVENKNEVLARAKDIKSIKKYLEGAKIAKEIYVPGKVINFVTK